MPNIKIIILALTLLLLTAVSPVSAGMITLHGPDEDTTVTIFEVTDDGVSVFKEFEAGETPPGETEELGFPTRSIPVAKFQGDNTLFAIGNDLMADEDLSEALMGALTALPMVDLDVLLAGLRPLFEIGATAKTKVMELTTNLEEGADLPDQLKASQDYIKARDFDQSKNDGAVIRSVSLYVRGNYPSLALPTGFEIIVDGEPLTPGSGNTFEFEGLDDGTKLTVVNTEMGLTKDLTLKVDTPLELDGVEDGKTYSGTIGSTKTLEISITDPDPNQRFTLILTKGEETIRTSTTSNGGGFNEDLTYASGTQEYTLTTETSCNNGVVLGTDEVKFSLRGTSSGGGTPPPGGFTGGETGDF